MKIEIVGDLALDKIDSAGVRMKMIDADGIIGNFVNFERDLFPAEFEHSRHTVTGSVIFEIEVKDTWIKNKIVTKGKMSDSEKE